MTTQSDSEEAQAISNQVDNLREFAQAILDKANAHAKSVGLWGMESAVLDMLVMSGKADKYQESERNAQVVERRALLLVTDFVNEVLHEHTTGIDLVATDKEPK